MPLDTSGSFNNQTGHQNPGAFQSASPQRQQYQDLYQPLDLTAILGPSTDAFWQASFGQTAGQDAPVKAAQANTSVNMAQPLLPQENQLDWQNQTFNRPPPNYTHAAQSPGNWQNAGVPPNSTTLSRRLSTRPDDAADPRFLPLGEFTKKDNWQQILLNNTADFIHVLSASGIFLYASASIFDLAGYRPDELLHRSISEFIHTQDLEAFVQQFNSAVTYGSDLALYFRFRKKDGMYLIFEMSGQAKFPDNDANSATIATLCGGSLPNSSFGCQCFFASARPYPSKTSAALDTFLDYKVENHHLQTRMADLYSQLGAESSADLARSSSNSMSSSSGDMSGEQDDPLADSTFNPAPSSGYNNIYGTSGTIPHGVVIPRSPQKQSTSSFKPATSQHAAIEADKRKPIKNRRGVEKGAYVCQDCGISESPEWRKGPLGPKTLCNACGLRFAKKVKAGPPKPTKGGQAAPKSK